jgi:hypothetical protein
MADGDQRRRRVRSSREPAQTSPEVVARPGVQDSSEDAHSAITPDVYDDDESSSAPIGNLSISNLAGGSQEDRDERSLRGLIGGGSSQVNVRAAMRARDASRPSEADLADAEANLTIVHRGWVPRDP